MSESLIPASQIAPAATRKNRICQVRESEPNSARNSTFHPNRLGTLSPVFSPSVDNLVAQLTRLPGVGQRTAQRLAFHLLRVPKDEALALARALEEVKERIRFCKECGNLTEDETC